MNDSFEKVKLTCETSGERIDSYLSRAAGLSRSRAAALIEEGSVSLNGFPTKKNALLESGDRILLFLPPERELEAKPENIPLDIVFEDDDLIVINKPQGMVVHPAPGNPEHTLVNALLFHCGSSLSGINGVLRPGIVHRIDQFTSGLLVAAKSDRAHVGLSELFQTHDFIRRYHAILYGTLPNDSGTIHTSIGRSKTDRKKMASFPVGALNAKEAITHYSVLERLAGYTYTEFSLETGRTHQIRVHAASIGHPVLADKIYAPGRKSFGLPGQCLHAKVLGFRHPVTGQEMFFESPLPDYFQQTLAKIRDESK